MTTSVPAPVSSAVASPTPAVCYSTCNNAYIAALKIGKEPELCASGSEFKDDYSSCQICIEANSGNVKQDIAGYIEPQFGPFLDYCASQASSTTVPSLVVNNTTTASSDQSSSSLPSSLQPFTSIFSSLTSSPSGSAYSTATAINTELIQLFNGSILTLTLTNLITLRGQPITTSSSIATDSKFKSSPVHAQFHGILFGSIFGGLSVIAFSFWIYWRFWRHQKLQRSKVGSTAGDENGHEKAQLHSECLRPKEPQEIDGSPNGPVAELPAVEPVGAELLGTVRSTEKG
ncbi:611b8d25-f5c8-4bed-8773-4fce0a61bdd5 [Sclerotinia trifoliorum]|uniref:611b8d25-f5c8-4bed-8773-4fce0a61bdd5 n=1 Tax=Sclerotinia trifoliorum TaxID=28548 RepID=A0A8H2VPW2_9HELO|nr:611b8d25-f5c8-4bed-8773-4fce0a61bdd5 [Sclerotinia trifoliorum]